MYSYTGIHCESDKFHSPIWHADLSVISRVYQGHDGSDMILPLHPDSGNVSILQPAIANGTRVMSNHTRDTCSQACASGNKPDVSATDVAADSTSLTSCQWGDGCGILLDDIGPGGIKRHLRDFHKQAFEDERGHCQWAVGDHQCGKLLNCAGLGKHVAACHIRSTLRSCDYCGRDIGRPDSLKRHMKYYCPLRGCRSSKDQRNSESKRDSQ